ncbi:hypothetical protein [Moraxella phage Mcat24]|nr:hypothetical protein [Moraxella phage Mcat24]
MVMPLPRTGGVLGGHQGRLFNIGMVMAGDILATATPAICPAPKTT